MATTSSNSVSPAEQRSDDDASDSSSTSRNSSTSSSRPFAHRGAQQHTVDTSGTSRDQAEQLVVLVSDKDDERTGDAIASTPVAAANGGGGNASNDIPLMEGHTGENFPTRFGSWDEFRAYLREFGDATYQAFRKRGSVNVARRNSRLPANSPWRLPLVFGFYWQNFICTHGVTRKSRSGGQRPRMASTRNTGCEARINATVTRDQVTRSYFIKVDVVGAHNHPIGREQYKAYAENRKVTDPALLRVIETMSARGENTKAIQAELARIVRETTGEESMYTRKHIYNIIYRFRMMRRDAQNEDHDVSREPNSDEEGYDSESVSGSDSDSGGDVNRSKRRRISNDTSGRTVATSVGQTGFVPLQKKHVGPRMKLSFLGVLLESSYCYNQIQNVVAQIGFTTVALYPGTLSGFKHQLVKLSSTEKPDDVNFVLPHYVIAGCEKGIVEYCRKYELQPQHVGVRLTVQELGSNENQLVTLSSRQLLTMKRFYLAHQHAVDAKTAVDWVASSNNLESCQVAAPFDEFADYSKELFTYSLSMMPFTSPAVSGVYHDIRNAPVVFTDIITSANIFKLGGSADSDIGDDFAKAVLLAMHSRFCDRAAFLSPSFMCEGVLADQCCKKGSSYGALLSPKRLVAGVAQLQSGRWGGIVLDCSRDVCYLYASDTAERKELQYAMSGLFTGYRLPSINFEASPPPKALTETPPSLVGQQNCSGILALLFVELMLQSKTWADLGRIESLDYFRLRYVLHAIQVVKKRNVHDIRWS